ncbi:hypothetical protein [Thalassotalea sp. ND16A]|uniref:hypothetical protein n=1 Tax=Thalassotalea sp. ND16A TaxID=1535422 RepID=UPI000519EFD2|nr:hypothetical protein [Thalassotalea sp. ND16A]KGJ98136.1 hypothetical protein ND16A_0941 [Thalassotalea sp. ND16A]
MDDFFILFDETQRERILMLIVFTALFILYICKHRSDISGKVTVSNMTGLMLPVYTIFAGASIGYAWLFKAVELKAVISNSELLFIAAIVLVGKGIGDLWKLFEFKKPAVPKELAATGK